MSRSLLALLFLAACQLPDDKGAADDTAADDTAADTDTHDTDTHEEPAEWGYSGETGPEHWGDLDEEYAACSDGMAQSPIDLVPSTFVGGTEAPPAIAWGTTALSAYNPGYYLRYQVDPGSTLTWGEHSYELVQFHFHGESEHTVDGAHTAVEIHFVHERTDDRTQLAVVAVLADADPTAGVAGVFDDGGALQFRDALALEESHEATALGGEVDLGAVFADVGSTVFAHYSGSLTTPPCTEGVEFFISGTLLPMLPDDVDAFHALYDFNYRPVQPLNGRVVSLLDVRE